MSETAIKDPVRLATTANITLSGEQTIDGQTTSSDRVLVKNQNTTTENGIYVSSSGAWERATDFDGSTDFLTGTMVRVNEGSANADTMWAVTPSAEPPEVGTSTLTWSEFTPSSSLGDDLTAIEALTGTGIARRTDDDPETWTVGDPVTNAELDNMAQATIKGRQAGNGTGDPEDLTGTQATAILDAFTGDSGSGGVKGLVPAPAAGDGAANKVLHADGTWDTPTTTLANMDEGTVKGRAAGDGTGTPEDLDGTDLAAIVDEMTGDGGSGGLKGLVPEQATGDGDKFLRGDATWDYPLESLIIAVTDETTPVTVGTNKVTFRMPYAFELEEVRASLTTAQSSSGSGGIVTVDINASATTILSTKLTIDNNEKTSTDPATPAVISDTALTDDEEITIDVDQIGDGTAKGLKVYLIGRQS